MGKLVLHAACINCGKSHIVKEMAGDATPDGLIFLGNHYSCEKVYRCEACGRVLFLEFRESVLATASTVLK